MKNYFKSYVWLVETLLSGPQTLRELQDLWLRSSANEDRKKLAPRTFANHVAAIADVFGIYILCDRCRNTYYIANPEVVGGSSVMGWMLDIMCVNNILRDSASLRERVLFEEVPSNRNYLVEILQAMRDSKKMEIHYESYRKKELEKLIVEPYFLREHKRRWYLYAYKGDADGPHMMALDRMKMVDILPDDFTMPKDFAVTDYFQGVYGARVYPNMKKERVLLKVYGRQVQYLKSLPLHPSQQEVETHHDYSVFSYYITPDYDFRQDVLSFGDKVEILAPESVREEMKKKIIKINTIYG